MLMLLGGCALAEGASDEEAVLTAEPWKSTSGTLLTLNADGTALLVSNTNIEGTWAYQACDDLYL